MLLRLMLLFYVVFSPCGLAQDRLVSTESASEIKIVFQGEAGKELSYSVRPLDGTPPSVDDGQSGIAPGFYQLVAKKGEQTVFEKRFLALDSARSVLNISFSPKEGYTLRQTVEFPQIKFRPGQRQLAPGNSKSLKSIADFLAAVPAIEGFGIEVHTDSGGDEKRNLELTEFRAINLRNELVKLGADPLKIRTLGAGSQYPLVPNDSKENRVQNRRVEYVILDKAGLGIASR